MADKDNKDMTITEQTRKFVNTPMTDDLKDKLDIMVREDSGGADENINYAAFMRKLIFQEWERRAQVRKVAARFQKKGIHLPTK
jgi:hypothetical protein